MIRSAGVIYMICCVLLRVFRWDLKFLSQKSAPEALGGRANSEVVWLARSEGLRHAWVLQIVLWSMGITCQKSRVRSATHMGSSQSIRPLFFRGIQTRAGTMLMPEGYDFPGLQSTEYFYAEYPGVVRKNSQFTNQTKFRHFTRTIIWAF